MFRGFVLIPPGTHIPFMRARKFYFAFSAALVLFSVALLAFKGLNYGIDFTGGIMIEAKFAQKADIPALRGTLGKLDLGAVEIQEFGAPDDVLIRVQRQEGEEKMQMVAIEKVKQALGPGVEYRRVESVGPKVGAELWREAILAVVLAVAGILGYVWFRFEWHWGVWAIGALVHDVLSTVALFSLTGLEFNLSSVAAVLTIAGYSINDTVVIYDRVRENLRKYKTMPLEALLDRSASETLSRTINTSLSTMVAVIILTVFGGAVIRDFTIALVWGLVIGTYSTVCFAVPMLLYAKIDRRAGETSKEGAAPGSAS